jgi:hypothetical protein
VLLGVALVAALALGLVMVIAIAAIALVFGGSKQATFVAGAIVGVLFDLGIFVIIAWFATRYALGIPACVIENLKAREALGRSVELSKKSRGRIFMLFLLVGVIQVGLLLLTQTPFYLYMFSHHLRLPFGLNVLSQIVSVATNTLVGPVLATGLTLFYFDQRVRKEGFDIEWMMQAAGMTRLAAGTGAEVEATAAEAAPLSAAVVEPAAAPADAVPGGAPDAPEGGERA